jgi:hypothetical protein
LQPITKKKLAGIGEPMVQTLSGLANTDPTPEIKFGAIFFGFFVTIDYIPVNMELGKYQKI